MQFEMPLTNIQQMLITIMCICALIISVRTQIDGTTVTRQNTENQSEIICPNNCTCLQDNLDLSISATCTELIDNSYSGANIKHFVLNKKNDIILGQNDLSAPLFVNIEAFVIYHSYKISDQEKFVTFPLVILSQPTYAGTLNIHPNVFNSTPYLKLLVILNVENLVDNSDVSGGYLFNAPSLESFFFSVSNHAPWTPSSFTNMSNLVELYIRSPKFVMKIGVFAPLRKLRSLTIDQAELWTKIKQNDFIDIPAVEELRLGNKILSIHDDAFSSLLQLKYLDISNNHISSFTENHLRNNVNLEVLNMSDNENLKRLPVFKSRKVGSDNYNIRIFECNKCGLQSISKGTFDAMPTLRELNLKRNRLETLPRRFFTQLKSLQSLDLAYNSISNIPTKMFEGANGLSTLILSRNPITTLEMRPFLSTPNLRKLDLRECRIKTWKEENISINSLRSLSISTNKLDDITAKHRETLPQISELQLEYNPIKCDKLNNIVSWSQLHNVTTQFFISEVYCIPDKRKTCWPELQKIMCSPNYTAEFEQIDQEADQFFNVVSEEKPLNGSASEVESFVTYLFIIMISIATIISNDNQVLFI